MDLPAFYDSIAIADATQGGISYSEALNMTLYERKAAIKVINELREKSKKSAES